MEITEKDNQFSTPILLLIFNRPELLKQVFKEIRKIKPLKLYVAADGPRENYPADQEKCRSARKIIENIDWPCQVFKLYRDRNLNCKLAITPAIDWFFKQEKEGIILEDDCVPNKSFFKFCADLLEKYRDNEKIMHIAGTNLQANYWRGDGTYFFSQIPVIVGWATWQRAWKFYDINMKNWPLFLKQNKIASISDNKKIRRFALKKLNHAYKNDLDEWDYQWILTIWLQNGLAIIPNINLITNIGYNLEATHTKHLDQQANLANNIEIKEIIHPSFILPDKEADIFTYKTHYLLSSRIIWHWRHKINNQLKYWHALFSKKQ